MSPLVRARGLADHRVVGEHRQAAGALDGRGHLALVLGAVAGDAAGDDLAALRDEVLQGRLILEVHLGVLLGAEAAHLLAAEAASAALVIVHAAAAIVATAAITVAVATATAIAAITTAETAAAAAEAAAAATTRSTARARRRRGSRLVIRTVHERSRSRTRKG